jgi:SCY1-like protein 1
MLNFILNFLNINFNYFLKFPEQPSSSSISTTTSSVTSMTSLEHESNDTSVSASDYGADNWDQENWGDMDVS